MDTVLNQELDRAERAIALARAERPAYSHIYPFLEALFTARIAARDGLIIELPGISAELAATKREHGLPLLNRWDFPIDTASAERVMEETGKIIPAENLLLAKAFSAIKGSIPKLPAERERFWNSFLHHEMEPWEEWVPTGTNMDAASVLFLARNAARPSIEFTAGKLIEIHPAADAWLKGYCPVCGSFPSLLYLGGEGKRKAFCSWCAAKWDLHRLQCPCCENRYHDSLGYISIEEEPQNRITYCNLCKFYFKQIDTRDLAYPPYLPIEEWTTLHLDLVAQKAGWKQPPSPAPAVYG